MFSESFEIGLFNFPPYYLVDSKEEVKGGLFVEMLKKIMDMAGYEYTFVAYSPKRLYLSPILPESVDESLRINQL